jgi:hypothetical protein
MNPRAIVVGVEVNGASRAYPLPAVTASGVVLDELGGAAIAIVRAPDGRSTRVFNRVIDGRALELISKVGSNPYRLADVETGSEWDFTGDAVGGPLKGRRLQRFACLEEFWFDWKSYHPTTEIARHVF